MILGAIFFPLYSLLAAVTLFLILQRYKIEGSGISFLACLFFWIIYAPIAIRSFDGVLSHFKVLRSKISAIFNRDSCGMLLRMRDNLKAEIHNNVQEHIVPLLGGEELHVVASGSGMSEVDLGRIFE